MTHTCDSELVRFARQIADKYGAQIVRVTARKLWRKGNYVEEGKYMGFLVLEIVDGKAVLFL
jgi:hypothetical protein